MDLQTAKDQEVVNVKTRLAARLREIVGHRALVEEFDKSLHLEFTAVGPGGKAHCINIYAHNDPTVNVFDSCNWSGELIESFWLSKLVRETGEFRYIEKLIEELLDDLDDPSDDETSTPLDELLEDCDDQTSGEFDDMDQLLIDLDAPSGDETNTS